MNNPFTEIVREKLAALQSYYRELAELQSISYEDNSGNHLYRRTTE